MTDGIVNIHGKQYQTVAYRIQTFRTEHPNWAVVPEIVDVTDEKVIVKVAILDENGMVKSVGHAEESRSSSQINRTSALENAETSACGRALAFLGLGGTEIASADEVASAISQQEISKGVERYVAMGSVLRDHIESIAAIKQFLAVDDMSSAKEAWDELTNDEKQALWVAPTKGGIFTTAEREKMKSTVFRTANGEAA